MSLHRALSLLTLPLVLFSCASSPDTSGGSSTEGTSGGVSSLVLLDATSRAGLGRSLTDGATLDLAALPTVKLDVRVDVDGGTPASVRFDLDGVVREDDRAPFTLAPDVPFDTLGWTPSEGTHTLTVTPLFVRGGQRVAGTSTTVRFDVRGADVSHLKYVAVKGAVKVYDLDRNYTLVRTIDVPGLNMPRGIAASAVTNRLYIPHWGDRDDPKYAGQPRFGYVTCLDLRTGQVLWNRRYTPSIDSLAVTPDGRKLYLPTGEETEAGSDGFWYVLDAATGDELSTIPVHVGAHNTVMGPGGRHVYLASLAYDELSVADTSTDRVVGRVGPFSGNIRPFTVNHAETLAFVTVDHKSGFEVGDLRTGKVLYSVDVQGFPWTDPTTPTDRTTQSHGIALTPDERELWVADHSNRMVHVFDVSGLPGRAPVQIADIDVREPDGSISPKWINFSRDGRLAHVSSGAIIDTRTRRRVNTVDNTRYFLQVDTVRGEPVRAYSRYGVGYGDPAR
ncbi:YncE family protein [Deinococcus pimensis]|uniref:YncE family protein n=1 Tax=Deinococcus pimensis TaxID=309888 RepID=UPI0004AE6999|nr:hypothetical protein [Deinococcus pimensis]